MQGTILNPKSSANCWNLGLTLQSERSVLALSIIVEALSITISLGTPPNASKTLVKKSNKYAWDVDGQIAQYLNLDADNIKLPTLKINSSPLLKKNFNFSFQSNWACFPKGVSDFIELVLSFRLKYSSNSLCFSIKWLKLLLEHSRLCSLCRYL